MHDIVSLCVILKNVRDRKSALQSEYRKAQQKEREYDTLSQNVSMLLEQPKDIVLPKEKTNELE